MRNEIAFLITDKLIAFESFVLHTFFLIAVYYIGLLKLKDRDI